MPRYHSMLELDPILPPKYPKNMTEIIKFNLSSNTYFLLFFICFQNLVRKIEVCCLVWSGHLAPNNSKISDDFQRMRLPWIAWCSSVGWGNGTALAVENPFPFEIWEALAEAPLDLELGDQGFGVGQGAAGASSALTHNYFQGVHVHNL